MALVVILGVVSALGPLLLAFAVWRYLRGARLRREWTRVDGQIVSWEHTRLEDSSISNPLIRFTTREGRQVEQVKQWTLDIGWYPKNTTVPVWYDPQDPQRFYAELFGVDRMGCLPLVGALLLMGVSTFCFRVFLMQL